MAEAVFIVQGEGEGHISQSIALKEMLEEAGHVVRKVYIGNHPGRQLPEYFKEVFRDRMEPFQSPYFLRTPNQKGIYVFRSILLNMFRSFTYLAEIRRIRKAILELAPDVVYNFYDLVGALAMRKSGPETVRIGVGHHFLLHSDESLTGRGRGPYPWLLKWHTSLIMRSCDRVLALSFRETHVHEAVEVIPPLIRKAFREISHTPGDRYLAYLMTGGYLYDLIQMCWEDPGIRVDVFTSIRTDMKLPPGIRIHALDETRFRELMEGCRGVISTAGFDTAAEAAYHAIPLWVIPARNHFEQYCNSIDVERSGIGTPVTRLTPGMLSEIRAADRNLYRAWVDKAVSLVLNSVPE